MSRRTLSDARWQRIESLLPGHFGIPGRRGVDNRLFVDAILWMAANAARWPDRPEALGTWTGVHARFQRWSHAVVRERLFNELSDTPDFDDGLLDSTISKVHAEATGAKEGGWAAAIGRSPRGLTAKLHAAVDALGLPLRVHPIPGHTATAPGPRRCWPACRGSARGRSTLRRRWTGMRRDCSRAAPGPQGALRFPKGMGEGSVKKTRAAWRGA